jgi:O-acetyl-ADP-ribose deacetylase (regulator of RNase III)
MKIKEVIGDITHRPEGINFIVHQANINRCMKSGVAKAICDKWPIVRQTDDTYNSIQKFNNLGDVSICRVEVDPNVFVANLYGQSLFDNSLAGCRTDYNAVINGFSRIRSVVEYSKRKDFVPIVGIPKFMGCDLAGGNWEIYFKIIEQTFIDTNTEIVIVNFGKTIIR